MTPAKPPRRRPGSRRWTIPPAPARRAHEDLRGTEILIELPGELGMLLWLLLRDVELWAGSSAELRPKLFRPGTLGLPADLPVRIAGDVNSLLAMTSTAEPGGGPLACRHIAAWAADKAPSTALLFAWAGAALAPESGPFARDVAVHALRAGEHALAESWLRRSIALSRRHSDWATYGRAHSELGDVLLARGQDARARAAYRRAMRVCRRHTLVSQAARARTARPLPDRTPPARYRGGRPPAVPAPAAHSTHHPDSLRVRVRIARVLAEYGDHAAVVDVLSAPAASRGPEQDRAEAARLLAASAAAVEKAETDQNRQ